MTEPTRWVIIDDRDSRISYSGDWTATSGADFNNKGNFGQVYSNTLHASNAEGASFNFRFNGNAARIMGTNDLVLRDGVADIDWDCTLDGRTVSRENYFPYTENNWVFCSFSNLVAGAHTIGVRVKTSGRSFLFDQIQYRPSGTVEGEVVAATRDDADLQYSSGWGPLANVAHNTMVRGSTATFRFTGEFNAFFRVASDTVLILVLIIGTGVSLWAMFPKELPRNPGDATYTLDGGSAVSFTIPGGGDISHYNRRIFGISGLSRGTHSITLQYTSTGGSTPLVIGQFLIEGGTNLRAPAPGSGSGPTTDGTTSSPTSRASDATTTPLPTTGLPDIVPGASELSSLATSVASANVPGQTDQTATAVTGGNSNGGGAAAPGDSNSSLSGNGGGNGDQVGTTSTKSQTPVGAIVGAILGVLFLIILVLGLIWYRRRRRIRLQNDFSEFSMTRDGHMQQQQSPPPTSHYAAATVPTYNEGSDGPSMVSMGAAVPPHPAAQTKRGPVFNSRYISNHDPYHDSAPFADSTQQLIPPANNYNSPPPPPPQVQPVLQPLRPVQGQGHHQNSGSISTSEAASSGYADSNVSSNRSRAVFHEDSGIRLPAHAAEEVVEYPPMYSYR
ncbi:hypothetical protein H1R20_g10966, partial [Candolleomyces eurysporus]